MTFWLAALLALQAMQVLQGYETVIAVYNTTAEHNSCSNGANYSYSIDDLPTDRLKSGTLLRFCSDFIILNKRISLSDLNSIALNGFAHTVMSCVNGSEVGIVLKRIHNLEVHNLTIENCGVMTTVDTKHRLNIKASVTCQNCTDILISAVTIRKSPGTGLALFYNSGSIRVESSVFEGNGYDQHSGGNGVYIEAGTSSYIVSALNATYIFEDCHFRNNSAVTGKDRTIPGFSRFDKGGGMCIYIRSNRNVRILIVGSSFIANKVERLGGGLFIIYVGKSSHNSVEVSNSWFIDNTATYGGALFSGYLHNRLKQVTPKNCSYTYRNVNFVGNHANSGGGTSIFSTSSEIAKAGIVIFENCTWRRNSGQYGAAVAIFPNAWNIYSRELLPSPQFVNCNVIDNEVKQNILYTKGQYQEYSKGSGAIHSLGHQITFEATTLFENNVGTALYLDTCVIFFKTNSLIHFTNNTGYQGGAIYELSSVIYILDGVKIDFLLNKAEDKGGAIYEHVTSRLFYDYSRTCFMDYVGVKHIEERNIIINFINNSASHYGHSIYASTLVTCYIRFKVPTANISANIFNKIGNFTFSPSGRQSDLATAVNHTHITKEHWSGLLPVTPGKRTQLPFVDIDDFGQREKTNYLITINNNTSNITTDQEVSKNTLLIFGESDSSAAITLTDILPRQNSLTFKVTMQACPPGFIHDESTQGCVCALSPNNYYLGIYTCQTTTMRAHRREGYWIGYEYNKTENEKSLLSGLCPKGYCSFFKSKSLLPEEADRNKLEEMICSKSRTGILCGRCRQNFSVYFHSLDYECKLNNYCNVGWLFYLLSEIIPVTVIFLIILFFNIPFTSGLVNGFIFYCQVVEMIQFQVQGSIPHSEQVETVHKISSLLYLSFSLDMFVHDRLSFCLWESAKAIDVQLFKFVTLAYALFLILLITLSIKYCTRNLVCRKFQRVSLLKKRLDLGGGVIHGLSAFLILCYAQCVRFSLALLTSATIYHKGPTGYKTMVFYNGEIEWMGSQHLPYAIPAILVAVFILILPPVLLLIYPLHNKVLSYLKVGETKCVQIVFGPLDKLKPFFDSLQGCFKDEFRFFSGLYFVYRFFIMFNVVIYYFQESFFYLEIQLVVMLIIHAAFQPYKKCFHNVIDTLLFGNLAIINSIIYHLSLPTAGANSVALLSILCVLVLLPLPLLGAWIVSPCVLKCWKSRKISNETEDNFEEVYGEGYERFN